MLKKIAVMVGVLMVWGFLAGSAKAAYKEVSLNGEWDFTCKSKLSVDTPELPDASAYNKKAKVPDYLYAQGVGFRRGTAFYRKSVDIPADWADESIQLYIGRAHDRINVWVNGKHIAFYPYITITPLLLDVSTILKSGEKNEIIISVDNMTRLTHKYAYVGGIVSKVCLKVSNAPGRIDDVYIKPGKDLTEVICQVDLKIPFKGKSLGSSQINWLVRDWKTEKVLGKGVVKVKKFTGDTTIKWSSRHQDIKPWHPNHPNLYIAELAWEKGGKIIDTLKQRFGLRRWSSEERALKLNGKPIYLRQVYGSPEMATHYRYPQDKDYWLKYFELIKSLGYNGVDWTGIASQEALEAADEIGIVIQCGSMSDGRKYLSKTLKVKNASLQSPFLWAKIAKWTRSYPSMSIYYLGGEMHFYDGFIDDVAKCNNAIKAVNPESLLLPNQAMCGIEYNFAPGDSKKGPERLERITKCSDIFGTYATRGFSYAPLTDPWYKINPRLARYKRPLIAHEVMQSGRVRAFYPKDGTFPSLRYGRKEIENSIYRWGQHPTSKAAVQRRIDRQDKKSLVHYENISRLSSIQFKYVGEKMRKCDNLQGYQDICCHGGLNVFLESSPGYTPEGVRRYNNDNVLLLDWGKGDSLNCCYWEKDKFKAKIMLSLYSEKPIEKGTLTWKLKDDNKVLLKKSFKTGFIPNGKVTVLKDIEFTWPKISRNSRLNLAVTLSGSGYNLNNDWNFWLFKNEPAKKLKAACMHNMYLLLKKRYPEIKYLKGTSSEKLWIVDMLTDKVIKHLREGGDVLLIGGKPFPLHTRWPKFKQGHRNHHNHGTTIYKHPVFKNIPNEGWGDWQFYPLLEGAAPVSFTNKRTAGYASKADPDPKMPLMKDVPFNPILEVLHLSRQAEQASIFELKAGKGRLFVSTCRVDMKNAVCVTLIDSILEYVSSSAFNPTSEVKIETLRKLIGESTISISGNEIRFKPKDFTGGSISPKYSCFYIKPRDGVSIGPKKVMQVTFELKKNQIPITKGKNLILSIDGQDCDKPGTTEIEILLNKRSLFKGINNCVKKGWSIWDIPFDKQWLRIGVNNLELRNLVLPGAGVSKGWFMIAGAKIKAGKEAPVRKAGIDTAPPIVKLISKPPLEKFAHKIVGTRVTVFTINAQDNLSGVKKIEISIDSERYMPYVGSFMLGTGMRSKEPGIRILRCRCIDYAGNKTTIFTGASEEGLDMNKIELEIR